MSAEELTGVPPIDGEYFARVTFGRRARGDETEDKLYFDLKYPCLPYGGMVSVQKLLAEGALQDLVTMGELTAELMEQPVLGIEEMRTQLDELKKGRGQGKGPVRK